MTQYIPCEYEVEVMKDLAGLENECIPGAAYNASMEFLRGAGYVTGITQPKLSNKGWDYLLSNGHYQ